MQITRYRHDLLHLPPSMLGPARCCTSKQTATPGCWSRLCLTSTDFKPHAVSPFHTGKSLIVGTLWQSP